MYIVNNGLWYRNKWVDAWYMLVPWISEDAWKQKERTRHKKKEEVTEREKEEKRSGRSTIAKVMPTYSYRTVLWSPI